MRAIHRKLLRDLWEVRGQGIAIALVIAAGVTMFIMSAATYETLRLTQESYYARYRFADVFAGLVRAPQRLAGRIAQIPGVEQVDTRVVSDVTLDVPGLAEPVTGRLISLGADHATELNGVALLEGRWPELDRADEVVLSEGFALARGLTPGDQVAALLYGRRRQLEIVGIGLSPEYVYTVQPGAMLPDEGRYGLLWMNRRALAAAFDMEGSFNDVALRLADGASVDDVIARLDRLIEPYGGRGAIPRDLQLSHWWLDDQLQQLRDMGMIVPTIFLLVAAFLLSVVLNRTVAVQREQIAALKALGYSKREIGLHYVLWGSAIAVVGGVLGVAAGFWLGGAMIEMQNQFFRFPFIEYRFSPAVIAGAFAISLGAAILGAASAVRRAVNLPPAEAMRPEPPTTFRHGFLERIGVIRRLSQPSRMIVRNLGRQPLRTVASILGIAFAAAILIAGLFSIDSMDEMMRVQFDVAQRQDLTVTFARPLSAEARHAIDRLPGVLASESMRAVPVRLRFGHRSRQAAITGLVPDARLNRIIDASLEPIVPPPEGLVLSATLAEILGVARGDEVIVEVLEGAQPVHRVRVAALVDEYMGMAAYMEAGALHRLLREGETLSAAYLQVDPDHAETLYRHLKTLPAVAGVALKSAAIDSFNKMIKDFLGVAIFFNVLFASIIACGVVYNTARISLSERSRELASLRVLGWTRGEISYILLGELAILTLAAVPLGLALGYGLSALAVTAYETEVYRMPLVVSPRVMAGAALVVMVAAALSGLAVRRRLDHLDLVAVLKTRE